MKYWIFQNNQVLGPYEPNEMEKMAVFSPESLVCPEGRRGTSMGDWQRAGMVPDLSAALVRVNAGDGGKTAVLSVAGLPSEPTLKDLAQLGSIQEKVASLEKVVLQLQENLRAKDAELSSLHQELSGKSREAGETDALKRQIAGLEERLATVRVLSETLDKAVEEEKRVELDVEKQGRTLTDLARDVEELRRRLEEAQSRPPEAVPASPLATPAPAPPSPSAPMEFPTINAEPMPSFDPATPSRPDAAEPQAEAPSLVPPALGDLSAGAIAPEPTPAPDLAPAPSAQEEPPLAMTPPAPKSKNVLLIGAALGLAALGGLAVMGGFVPGLRKPKAPVAVLEPEPAPPPEPTPPPAPDMRQLAVEFAKTWPLPGDRTLERALEDLAPSSGNLSPWMADPLAGSRVQVNYFARSPAPGAPTIAYEFEVDLEGKTLVGRNAAAKSVLTGVISAPPAPPKPKPVKVKAKAAEAKPRPSRAKASRRAPKEKAPAADETLLDDLLKE